MPDAPESGRSRCALLTILLLLCSGITVTGYHYYQTQRGSIESRIQGEISAIADLKVQQVLAWRNERIADAQLLAAYPLVGAPPTPERDRQLRDWLEVFRRHAGYAQVALLDSSGGVRISASDGSAALNRHLLPLVQESLRSREVVVSDLYTEPGGFTYMDVVAPVPVDHGRQAGATLLHVEASAFLFAIVQAWPTPSPTAESLLVCSEGDRFRFLNQLRHNGQSARQFTGRSGDDLPAALAARGIEGIRYGTDYRGVTVLAALRQVPGTPWALVAKVDADEIYAPSRQQSRTTALIVGLLLAACLASYGFFWHLQQSRLYKRRHLAELERGALEDRYAQLRRHINDIVLLLDDHGKILEVNDRAVTTYGYSIDELLRLSIRDLSDPSDLASFESRWENLAARNSEVFEGLHRRKDGSSVPVEVSSRAIEVEGRRYRHSVIRDISDRKRAEEESWRATRAMRVLSASNQAVIRSGDEDRLLRDICEAITHAGGYPLAWVGLPATEDGKPVRVIAVDGGHPEYADSLGITWNDEPSGRGPVGTAIRTGRVAICNDASADPDFAPWRERAAQYGYKAILSLPLRSDDTVIGALTIYASESDAFHPEEVRLLEELAADLSYGLEARRRRQQQARAEMALLQSVAEFRTLFDAANDAIFIADANGRFLEANQVACQRLGYTRDELLSMSIHQIDAPACAGGMPQKQTDLMEDGEALLETVHLRKDGSELPVEINSRVFRYRQQPAILCLARDISERKRAAALAEARTLELERAKTEAENANRAKSEFLANMSHEIRTPMNGIIGTTSLLLDTQLSLEQRDYAETIRKSADALLGIVNDILDLSKIEAGKLTIEPGAFDVVACLAETGDFLAPHARLKGLEYSFVAQTDVRWVWGDAGRTRQIVLNLLSNAIKFTDCGRIALRVTSSPAEGGCHAFRIAVADSGIGIAAGQMPLLFREFSQADSSLVKKHQGAGLGLAISRELAGLMGGSLTVSSELGKGSTFLLTIPWPPAAPYDVASPAPEVLLAAMGIDISAKRRRILLAEDNPVNQKIAVRMLEKMGCHVDLAGNGREAVEMIGRFPYDLILMDCGMPEMDGLAASREIRARLAGGARTPIVALTAHVIAGTREQCIAAGMDDYVSKPVTPATVENILRKWSP